MMRFAIFDSINSDSFYVNPYQVSAVVAVDEVTRIFVEGSEEPFLTALPAHEVVEDLEIMMNIIEEKDNN